MSDPPPPLADVRLFLSTGDSRGFDRAVQVVDVGVMRFGGLVIRPVPAPHFDEDAYLVGASVELNLEPGLAGARWAEAGFEFAAPEVAVIAAMPRSVRTAEPSRTYRIDSELQFVPAPEDRTDGPMVFLESQDPVVQTFGIGTSRFWWRWTATEHGAVEAGTRIGWFILVVPAGMRQVRVRPTARYRLSAMDTDGLQPSSDPVEVAVTLPLPEPEPTRGQGRTVFSGAAKLAVIQRLGRSWRDLADVLEIPGHERTRFGPGDEPRDLWQWLDERERLAELPAALRAAGRPELAELLTR